jgi:ABC-type arginine transport system permease subunit
MGAHQVKRLLVTKDDAFVSVISLGDIAQATDSMDEIGEAVREITESPATTEGTPS